MSYLALYDSILKREPLPVSELQPNARIAARYRAPNGLELDVMKIERIGYAPISPYKIAVAKICPGQASFRILVDGTAKLNPLQDLSMISETARFLSKNPLMVDYPGCTTEQIEKEKGILRGMEKAYWIPLIGSDFVSITKNEMRTLQDLLR